MRNPFFFSSPRHAHIVRPDQPVMTLSLSLCSILLLPTLVPVPAVSNSGEEEKPGGCANHGLHSGPCFCGRVDRTCPPRFAGEDDARHFHAIAFIASHGGANMRSDHDTADDRVALKPHRLLPKTNAKLNKYSPSSYDHSLLQKSPVGDSASNLSRILLGKWLCYRLTENGRNAAKNSPSLRHEYPPTWSQ